MKTTDYRRISRIYDRNPIRHRIEPEPLAARMVELHPEGVVALDLACGTGNFIRAQLDHHADRHITWHGCDLSDEMLSVAREKLPGVPLAHANADALPYPDGTFHLVSCRFAFHHFANKRAVLREIFRVLEPAGMLAMYDIDPYAMPASWVYHYFPPTRRIDRNRFWPNQRLFRELDEAGFQAVITTDITFEKRDLDAMMREAENRDMSQLNLISDRAYRRGLRALRSDRGGGRGYSGDFALSRCEAERAAVS